MGKTITCHHGTFNLPSEIFELEIHDNHVIFHCENGDYEAKQEKKWEIIKI